MSACSCAAPCEVCKCAQEAFSGTQDAEPCPIPTATPLNPTESTGSGLDGLQGAGKVFTADRFNCGLKTKGVRLKCYCKTCDAYTLGNYPAGGGNGLIRNECARCGKLRTGQPFIGSAELAAIRSKAEKIEACR